MNIYHIPRRQATSLLAALSVLACPPALAQQKNIDCDVAFDMAVTAYQGVRDALSQEDQASAYRLKDVFWRIEKYSGGCKSVRKMGEALAERKLGPRDKLASSYGTSGSAGSSGVGSGFAGSSGSASGMTASPTPSDAGQASGSSGTGSAASGSSTSSSSGSSGTSDKSSNGH
jgi:hypothetical protein